MSSLGYIIPVDPVELASRFPATCSNFDEEDDDPWATEDDLDSIDVAYQEIADFFAASDYESQVSPLLDRIPDREADLIELYFLQHKRQADIADIFGVTQAAVSYRLDRGIQRLRYLLSIPQVTEEELRDDLCRAFPNQVECPKCSQVEGTCPLCNSTGLIHVDVEILVGMWMTTCQSEVALILNLTQGRVRHRFFKAVSTLAELAEKNEDLERYSKIFGTISRKNFNILREVKLPQWSGRGKDECL